MLNKSIADDIKHTGWAIRDWLGPYYMLGGAVAFGIAMLTLLDQDGTLHLTRIVGAVLFLATVFAWCFHFYRQRQQALTSDGKPTVSEAPKAKFHGILLAVTLFFMAGILVSEALMHNHRKDLVSKEAATSAVRVPVVKPRDSLSENEEYVDAVKVPTLNVEATTPLFEINIPQGALSGASNTVSPSVNVSHPLSGQSSPATKVESIEERASTAKEASLPAATSSNASEVSSSATAPASVAVIQWPSAPTPGSEGAIAQGTTVAQITAPPPTRPQTTSPKPVASADAGKCSRLSARFSSGDDLSAEDLSFMRNSCRQK